MGYNQHKQANKSGWPKAKITVNTDMSEVKDWKGEGGGGQILGS